MNKQEIEKAIEILQLDIKRWSKNDIPKNTESLGLQAVLKHREEKISAYKMAISALTQQLNNGWIPDVIHAIGMGKTVTCTVDDGNPVIYKVKVIDDIASPHWGEECLTINGKVYDSRNFNVSFSQILYGKWEVSE